MAKGTVNKVILIGRLGKDPEMRYTAEGTAIANFSIATSDGYKDKRGQYVDQTEWHKLTAIGRPAEIVGQYLKKGATVYVEGKIQTSKWQDKHGSDRYSTEIKVNELQLLGGKEEDPKAGKPQASATNSTEIEDEPIPF